MGWKDQILELYSNGDSCLEIEQKLNVNRTSIRKVVKRKFGFVRQGLYYKKNQIRG
jgi:transposase-like protein